MRCLAKNIAHVFVLAACLHVGAANAEAWQFIPTIYLTERYNDNINFSSSDEKSVLESQLRSRLSFSRLTEVSEVTGRLHANFSTYSKDDEFFTFSSHYRFTELSQWRMKGFFQRDTTARSIELVQSSVPDEEDLQLTPDDVDDGLVQIELRRNTVRLEPTIEYKLTERLTHGVSYKFDGVFYENNYVETGLFGYNQHSVGSSLAYGLSQRDGVVVGVAGSRFSSKSNANIVTDRLAIQVRYKRLLSELMQTELSIGTAKIVSESDVESSNGQSYFFNANILYNEKLNRIKLEIGRDVRPSGSGSLVEISNIRIDVRRRFLEKLSGSLRVRAFETKQSRKQARLASENTRYVANLDTSFSWEFNRWWGVEAGYSYRIRNEKNSTNDADGNSIFASVRYSKRASF